MLTGTQCRNAKPKVGLYHEVKPYRQKIILRCPCRFMNFIHSGYLMCVIIFPPDFVSLGHMRTHSLCPDMTSLSGWPKVSSDRG